MASHDFRQIWLFGSYLLALSSIILTHIFSSFSLAEGTAIAAFIAGVAYWKLVKAVDRWLIAGALLGLGGLLLKGIFIAFGIGVSQHDMTTHEVTPGHPLLVHIHHLFFNVGFLCYSISAIWRIVIKLREKGIEEVESP